jgi:hypothetical protein
LKKTLKPAFGCAMELCCGDDVLSDESRFHRNLQMDAPADWSSDAQANG